MKLVTVAQMRELDRRTIEESNIPGEDLMDRAGWGVADHVRRMAEVAGFHFPSVLVIAGRGNNGGDGFACARYLKEMGTSVEVWLAGAAAGIRGDALKHLSRMKAAGIKLREIKTMEEWQEERDYGHAANIVVDAVLGVGSSGPARGPAAGAIQFINARLQEALIISVDVPSGLDADTGIPEGDVVCADVTVTMGLPKRGLVSPLALDCVGSIEVVDIGIPADYVAELALEDERELIYLTDLKPLFPRRRRATHKGHYGHVLLIGGARGYSGSIAMAAKAALRSGVGLVTVVVPESIAGTVAGASLESMVVGARETSSGALSKDMWADWKTRIHDYDAVLVGPGLTRGDDSRELVQQILAECRVPLVLDADAISVLPGRPELIKKANCPVVITPHPGELATLLAKKAVDIQEDRYASAGTAVEATGATVVLKGAGTIVAQEGRAPHINLTGNPGMATGGSGDVLAGLLVGFLGQKLKPFDVARAAVYLHGRAGDMVAWRKSQAGLVAGDLIDELPYVFRDVALR
ncbi:MAG TPA: NAD(P)H-hydrate dehydratase [Kiritimatiellia bacterium]|nr:NAD(P)H-hydrate dehydratase [Kiritimatiellia bacterium]